MRAQKLRAALGDGHPHACSSDAFARYKTAVDRVLPDRQARARGAPRLDHLGIQPWLPGDPFDEVEHQSELSAIRYLRRKTWDIS